MQTFLISPNPSETAKILDSKRLGKQRIETIQILNVLLNETEKKGWRNHPAVRMWKGYEPYLVKVYLKAMIDEWEARGYNGPKCKEHYNRLYKLVESQEPEQPIWFCERFYRSHKSNLIRKKPEYYSEKFPEVPDNFPYFWPK